MPTFASVMDLWQKIRRSWSALSIRIKLRKSGGVVAGGRGRDGGKYGGDNSRAGGGGGGGLLKLRDDVQMCGYKDVEIMWNMLGIENDKMEAAPSSASAKIPKRGWKHSRIFFWTNHRP